MPQLNRITTEYIAAEDRIRLTGATAGGGTLVLWLTQRLLNRLVPQLLAWLERQPQTVSSAAPEGRRDLPTELINTFAQQAARNRLQAQPPVRAEGACHTWLVRLLDIQQSDRAIRVVFRHPSGAEPGPAVLILRSDPLRQWLNVLHDHYLRAGWPMEVWPAWVTDAGRVPRSKSGVVH